MAKKPKPPETGSSLGEYARIIGELDGDDENKSEEAAEPRDGDEHKTREEPRDKSRISSRPRTTDLPPKARLPRQRTAMNLSLWVRGVLPVLRLLLGGGLFETFMALVLLR